MAVSGVKLAVGTGAVSRGSTITRGDFSLTFDKDVLFCETVDGFIHVHPNGAAITAYAPSEASFNGSLAQRFTKNPVPWFNAAGQGFDGRVTSYSTGKVVSLPHAPITGDSILLEKAGELLAGANTPTRIRRGVATAWQALQFTSALPTPERLAGPLGWWNLKTPVTYAIDIAAKVAALPRLSLSGVDAPPVSDVIARLDQYWGAALLTPNALDQGYEAWVPQSVMNGLAETNYGEYLAILIGAAAGHLIGDAATTGQKKTILLRLVQMGKEILEGGRGVGKSLGDPTDTGLAGHCQWEWIPMLCYLWSRDLEDDLDNLRTLMPTNILGQPFYWTADRIAQLAPHSDVNKICISRRRTITAVSGTTITYSTIGTADAPRMNPKSLIMTRESDGATATVMTFVDTQTAPGTQQVTIDVQPGAPFQLGDTIYFQPAYAISEGDVDWRVFQADKVIVPNAGQDYRNQQMWLDEILFPHALGIWRDDWNVARNYVLRCMSVGDPAGFPTPWSDRSLYFVGATPYQFDKSMWDAHAASFGLA